MPPAIKADKPSHPSEGSKFKHPKLKHGVLRVRAPKRTTRSRFASRPATSAILQVDVGDDGSPDFSFEPKEIARSPSMPGPATTSCASTTATVLHRQHPDDARRRGRKRHPRRRRSREPDRRRRQRRHRRKRRRRHGAAGRRRRHLRLGSRRRQRRRRRPGRHRHDALQRQAGAEQVDLSANGNRLRFFRTQGRSRWTPPASNESTSTPRRRRLDHRQRPQRNRRQRRPPRPRRHPRRRRRRRPEPTA